MTVQYRAPPTYMESFIQDGKTSAAWYRFHQAMHLGIAPNQEVTITVGTSPFVYIAPQGGFVMVNGGTVSKVQFTRTKTYTTGQTAGMFPVSLGDQITVTYSSTPTMTFVSQ